MLQNLPDDAKRLKEAELATLTASLDRKAEESKVKKVDKRYKHIKFFGR